MSEFLKYNRFAYQMAVIECVKTYSVRTKAPQQYLDIQKTCFLQCFLERQHMI